jgi:hypothetical protein
MTELLIGIVAVLSGTSLVTTTELLIERRRNRALQERNEVQAQRLALMDPVVTGGDGVPVVDFSRSAAAIRHNAGPRP